MDDHTRRCVLAGVGVAWSSLAAGCLDDASDPGSGTNGDEQSTDDSDESGSDDGDNDDGTDGTGDAEDKTDPADPIEEAPRVDEPPHEIERPEEPDDPDDDWNDHYLGETMADEPSLEFEVLPQVGLLDPGLENHDEGEQYRVALLESQTELDETLDLERVEETVRETLEALDFDERTVVIVESGWGSSSVQHQWVRAENEGDTVHLHGYYTDPHAQTMDIASRYSVLTVERPADLEVVRASLTVSEDRRVHVNSTEGVVSVDEGE